MPGQLVVTADRSISAHRQYQGNIHDRLDSDGGGYALVIAVALDFEIVVAIIENTGRPAVDFQPWQGQGLARQLQVRLFEMIAVQVAVATGPDEIARFEIALLGQHVRQQGIRGDVEWHAEKNIGAAQDKRPFAT